MISCAKQIYIITYNHIMGQPKCIKKRDSCKHWMFKTWYLSLIHATKL